MNINYEYYRCFYYAAKYQNLTLAAENLGSNQPNLSRIIKLLEHEFGCSLFLRSNRGLTLTPEGEQLYSHVKIAVEQLQTAEEELHFVTGLQKGIVTIGVSETALRLFLLPVLNNFKQLYPDIRVRIQNHLADQAIESVQNGSVDFAVVVPFGPLPKSLQSCLLMTFQDILIGGKAFSSLADKPLSLAELEKYPLVCLDEHTMTYQFYEHFYRSHGLSLKPELEVAATDQILPIVKNNLGWGFIPEIFAKEALASGEVVQIPLQESIPSREIYLVEKRERPLSIAAGALKNMLLNSPM